MNNLQIALKELNEEWLASLPELEEMPKFEVSPKYIKWEQRVIYGKKSTSGKVIKIILIAATIIVLFSVIALSTTKGREFFMHFFKESAVYSLDADKSEPVNSLAVDYLPHGFVLKDTDENNSFILHYYENQDKYFNIQKHILQTAVDFDYKSEDYEVVEVNGVKYIVSFVDENICNVIWNYNNYNYQVSGNLGKEEVFKIALGVH